MSLQKLAAQELTELLRTILVPFFVLNPESLVRRGPKGYNRNVLWNCYLATEFLELDSVLELTRVLRESSDIAEACGITPTGKRPSQPSLWRFFNEIQCLSNECDFIELSLAYVTLRAFKKYRLIMSPKAFRIRTLALRDDAVQQLEDLNEERDQLISFINGYEIVLKDVCDWDVNYERD